MLIFVKTKTGKTLSVDVERADTIQTLKGKIQEREGVPPVQQNLVFAGKPLEDAKSLADYGIDREAIVHLILKEAPKPPPAPAPVVHAKEKGPAAAPVPAVSDLNEAQKAEFLTSFARGSTSNSVEIVFSFDTTGSMSSCLALVRDKVTETVTRLLRDVPNIRIGMIAHGDYCDQMSSYVLKKLDLTSDVDAITQWVRGSGSTGGGDAPEAYELALREANTMDWSEDSAKALVVIGDEVPHPPSYTTQKIYWRDEVEDLSKKGVKIYGVRALQSHQSKDFYEELSSSSGTVSIHFNNFHLIVDMFLAICYREASPEMLQDFCDEMKSGGKMNQGSELATILETLSKPNPEKESPNKKEKKAERASNNQAWYNIKNDHGSPSYDWDGKKWVPVGTPIPRHVPAYVVGIKSLSPIRKSHEEQSSAPPRGSRTIDLSTMEAKKLRIQRRRSFLSKITFGHFGN